MPFPTYVLMPDAAMMRDREILVRGHGYALIVATPYETRYTVLKGLLAQPVPVERLRASDFAASETAATVFTMHRKSYGVLHLRSRAERRRLARKGTRGRRDARPVADRIDHRVHVFHTNDTPESIVHAMVRPFMKPWEGPRP